MAVDTVFILAIVAGTVVPGDFFTTERFYMDSYYDHVIDYGLKQMKPAHQEFVALVDLRDTILYDLQNPAKGEIVFKGIRSFTKAQGDFPRTRQWHTGELDLLATFKFSNFSGVGNFNTVVLPTTVKPYIINFGFSFSTSPAEVQVLFKGLLPIKKKRGSVPALRTAFQFVKPPIYDCAHDGVANFDLILQEKSLGVFNEIFKDLQLRIDDYLNRVHRDDPKLDDILDKIIHAQSLKQGGLDLWFNGTTTKYHKNHTEKIGEVLNMTVYGLQLFKRTSRIEILSGIEDEALDLRFTVNFGNISGTGIIFNKLSDKPTANISLKHLVRSSVSRFNFTAPPTVVEVSFYLPRNKSHIEYAEQFQGNPKYNISMESGDVDNSIIGHANSMYRNMLHNLLKATHFQLFP